MDLNSEVHRAGEARQILDSPLFIAARANIEDQMRDARRTVPLKDTDMHTRLILLEQLWGNLIAYFEQIALTGTMAEIQLREAEKRKSFLEQGIAMFRAQGRNI